MPVLQPHDMTTQNGCSSPTHRASANADWAQGTPIGHHGTKVVPRGEFDGQSKTLRSPRRSQRYTGLKLNDEFEGKSNPTSDAHAEDNPADDQVFHDNGTQENGGVDIDEQNAELESGGKYPHVKSAVRHNSSTAKRHHSAATQSYIAALQSAGTHSHSTGPNYNSHPTTARQHKYKHRQVSNLDHSNKPNNPFSCIPADSCKSEQQREKEFLALEQRHVHDVYDHIAPHFSDTRYKAWPKVQEFLEQLEPGSLVADVGCGNGKYLGINKDIYILGSDHCHKLVEISASKGHNAMLCDNLQLPYRDGIFDAVISIAVIHHFSTAERRNMALRELARILRPGGVLMVYVWAMEQEKRKFEAQDILVPWQLHPRHRRRRSNSSKQRGEYKISSTSSISDDDFPKQGSFDSSVSDQSLETGSESESSTTRESASSGTDSSRDPGDEIQVHNRKSSLRQEALRILSSIQTLTQGFKSGVDPEISNAVGKVKDTSHVTLRDSATCEAVYETPTVTRFTSDFRPFLSPNKEKVKRSYSVPATETFSPRTFVSGKNSSTRGTSLPGTPAHKCESKITGAGNVKSNSHKLGTTFTDTFIPKTISPETPKCECHSQMRQMYKEKKSASEEKRSFNLLDFVVSKITKKRSKSETSAEDDTPNRDKVYQKLIHHIVEHEGHHFGTENDIFSDIGDEVFQVREFPQSSRPQPRSEKIESEAGTDNCSDKRHNKSDLKVQAENCSVELSTSRIQRNGTLRDVPNREKMLTTQSLSDATMHSSEYITNMPESIKDAIISQNAQDGNQPEIKRNIPKHSTRKQSFEKRNMDKNKSISGTKNVETTEELPGQYQRYYHVFKKGELVRLIEKHVKELEVLESYFDHANWCVIARKVQS
ncbi:unnamed protein product [Owenia fusiformis]|uniref:Uncharacterized protein n=1 Tax=Owenia fusiformis TaxID=6347 RepID=A0A8J1TEP7_OWEFU|nr:unnamed protein product [Owenia fusiformis]